MRMELRFFGREFGCSAPQVGQEEVNVVAETSGAARVRVEDAAPRAFGLEQDLALRVGDAQGAHEARARVLCADACEFAPQSGPVRAVPFFPGRALSGVARRVHPRSSAQRVDDEAAVIGETREPERAGVADGFAPGVAREGVFVFRWWGRHVAELGEAEAANAERPKELPEFGHLVGVGRGQDEGHLVRMARPVGADNALPAALCLQGFAGRAPPAGPCRKRSGDGLVLDPRSSMESWKRSTVHAKPSRPPEILAPAGTEESFAAALASGADAVYLGLAEGFNARGRSTAFRLADLPALVHRAHAANAKLYLTLNTLVFESELEALEDLLRSVVQSGVDALIVQDPATAFLARRLSPTLRLHASTQMTISSPEGAAFAKTLGMDRVVLPRELSVQEVARFTRESTMECEVFVHGALCVSWSGQCLTSEAFSERSANRGQCSQACRMPYEAVVDGERKELGDVRYLLSPQDLAGHAALPALLAAGVHSLKIEGRYKGPAYVTSAVDSFRHYRDALLRGPTAEDDVQLRRDVERTQLAFSRGGSMGFLHGDDHQTLVVGNTPKHRGLPLGHVIERGARTVLVRLTEGAASKEVLRPGVGVKFELLGRSDAEQDPENAPGGPLFGLRFVESELVELSFGRPGPDLARVRAGDAVRLTGDPEIQSQAERRLRDAPLGRIPLEIRASGQVGEPFCLDVHAESTARPLRLRVHSRVPLARAQAGGLDIPLLTEKLGALGGTSYRLSELELDGLSPGLHIPVSELKRLRREVVEQLDKELLAPPVPSLPTERVLPLLRSELSRGGPAESRSAAHEGPAYVVPLLRTEEQLDAVLGLGLPEGSEVELDWMEMVGLTRAVQRARGAGLRVTLATVRVQKPGEEAYDRRISRLEPDGVLVRHWGALMSFAQGRAGAPRAVEVHGDFSLNVTNSLTAHHLLNFGLETLTASHDLNRAQLLELLRRTPRGRVAVTLHHHIPTFHNSHCVYAHLLSDGKDYKTCGRPCEAHRIALRDYAGHEHPVIVDVGCRNTVFNAQAQSAAPLVPELLELGVRRFRVELVWESGEDTARVLRAYHELLTGRISPATTLERARVHERYGVTTPLQIRKR